MKKNTLILALGLIVTPTLAMADVVLSEVLYDAPNNYAVEEYVELFNASCSTVNLSNYTLQDNGATYQLSGTVAPNSYFVVARNAAGYQGLFNQAANLGNLSLTLGNSGDYVKLLKSNATIDTVAWEGGLAGWSISTRNKSIHRTSLSSGNSAWAVSSNAGSHQSGDLTFDCAPVIDNKLSNNQAKTNLSANKGDTLNYTFEVAANASKFTVTTAANNGDADLIVSLNGKQLCKPYLEGSNEQCRIASPKAGRYSIDVNAYQAFNGLSLTAKITAATPPPVLNTVLSNNVSATVINIAQGSQAHYQVDLPAKATDLKIAITGGSGDADLYLQFDKAATKSSHICRPYLEGNEEVCKVAVPSAGQYHIMLDAYRAVSDLTLTASFTVATATTPPLPVEYQFDSYYEAAINQTGATLKSALNTIIKDHVRFTYSQAWDGLGYADEDPNNTDNVILLYTNRSEPKINRAGMSNSQDAWNREHVWAKSHGFPSSAQHAYTDLHHLRPADVSVNSARGNKDFLNGGSEILEAPGTFTDTDSFEPVSTAKGDVARMIFYMDVRYQGNDSSGTPDLSIANGTTSTGVAQLGDLCTLLQWHLSDPVSDWERRRNNRIFQWQKNRNPFIDNPQWVTALYQGQCQ